MTSDPAGSPPAPFRVAFVPGVTPDKWARLWAERMPDTRLELVPVDEKEQTAVLYDGRADMALVRLPVDAESLHTIELYREVPVVVAPQGHFVEAAEEVTSHDLACEHVHAVPPLTAREAVETVAAGVGVVVLPMSLARLHNRKDVVHRPVVDMPQSPVGLAWPREVEDERFEVFIGVVRGRTANSTRGGVPPAGERPPPAGKRASAGRPRPSPARASRGRSRRGRR